MPTPHPNSPDLARSELQPDSVNRSTATHVTHSVGDVAMMLGVSNHTVYRLLTRKILRALPGLRIKRITDASVQRYLAS